MMNEPKRIFLTGALLAGTLLLWAASARADEIVVRDLASGQESTVPCYAVTSETWAEVKYKERKRSAEKSVPTISVVRIKRNDKSKAASDLVGAIDSLNRGNFAEAASALHDISGGGWYVDTVGSGDKKYVSFSKNDPTGKNKRPTWISEYAHFYYAKALFLAGEAKNDRDLIEEALLALDDVPVPGGKGKTGGFLGRFSGGNSRFVPEAMALKARALKFLARYDDAGVTFNALHKAAISIPLDPQWAYEGLIGTGSIAEAKGDFTRAVESYRGAITTMLVLLGQESRTYMRQRYGRYYSQARMRVARLKLQVAEKRKAASAFADLRNWITEGQPEAIRRTGKSKGLPAESIAALVAGARDPLVQAVGYNGIGLAYLREAKPKYVNAMLAFKAVAVKYFEEPEQHARALYYLAQAAEGASKGAKGEVQSMYASIAEQALTMLRSQHPESSWARK